MGDLMDDVILMLHSYLHNLSQPGIWFDNGINGMMHGMLLMIHKLDYVIDAWYWHQMLYDE
jgi:hypothetical protein